MKDRFTPICRAWLAVATTVRRANHGWGQLGRLWSAIARSFYGSIRIRFGVAFAGVLLGLTVLAGITVISNRAILHAFDVAIAEAQFELLPVHELQVSLRDIEQLLYSYASEGDPVLVRIKELQQMVDHNFRQLEKSERKFASFDHVHSRISIPIVHEAWNGVQGAILDVLRQPPRTTEAAEALTRARVMIDPINNAIAEYHHFSMLDLQERFKNAEFIVERTYFLTLGSILVGLGILVVLGRAVGRSILQPITALREAAHKLAQKDFSYRVVLHNKKDELGQLGRAFNIALAILQRMYRYLDRRATYDGLTGVLNRVALDERLSVGCKNTDRHGRTLSLLMVDIDFFKRVNDNYGHQCGDHILQAVARLLNESIRAGDVLARYGGEEFTIILPETDEAAALALAERLRRIVAEAALNCTDNANIGITISIGCANRGPYTMSSEDLIKAADMAVYHAKQTGRNRVVVASAVAPTSVQDAPAPASGSGL